MLAHARSAGDKCMYSSGSRPLHNSTWSSSSLAPPLGGALLTPLSSTFASRSSATSSHKHMPPPPRHHAEFVQFREVLRALRHAESENTLSSLRMARTWTVVLWPVTIACQAWHHLRHPSHPIRDLQQTPQQLQQQTFRCKCTCSAALSRSGSRGCVGVYALVAPAGSFISDGSPSAARS